MVFPLFIILFGWLFYNNKYGFSPILMVYTALIFIAGFINTIRAHKEVKSKDLANADLITVQEDIIKGKKKLSGHILFRVIIVLIWCAICIHDMFSTSQSFVAGLVTGLIAGGIVVAINIIIKVKTYNKILIGIREYGKE